MFLCGLKGKGSVGSFHVLSSSPLLHNHPNREKEAVSVLPAEQVKKRLLSLFCPRATGTAAGKLCSVSKQIKTLFKKNERIWQAQKSFESLLEGVKALKLSCCALENGS